MGCSSCGKNLVGRSGSTANTAIIIGEINNSVVRVRVARDVLGLMAGAVKYVRGDGLQAYLDSGELVQLAGGARPANPLRQGTSLYYVDGIGYTDMGTARVRSGQTGSEIVVKTVGSQ